MSAYTLDGKSRGFPVVKAFERRLKVIQALAQSRTHRFGVQIQFRRNLIIAQIAEVAQVNNFAAGLAELFQRQAD
jgi:hypothetical protein